MIAREMYYLMTWPECQKYQGKDGCYEAFDGFTNIVFVPKSLIDKEEKSPDES